jgi:hypothetical protein
LHGRHVELPFATSGHSTLGKAVHRLGEFLNLLYDGCS